MKEANTLTKEELQMEAFQIISIAGDAYSSFYEAMTLYKQEKVAAAKKKLDEGSDKLIEAHQIQTTLIHAEVNNLDLPFSLIMTHAQDHLMMANCWENLAKVFID